MVQFISGSRKWCDIKVVRQLQSVDFISYSDEILKKITTCFIYEQREAEQEQSIHRMHNTESNTKSTPSIYSWAHNIQVLNSKIIAISTTKTCRLSILLEIVGGLPWESIGCDAPLHQTSGSKLEIEELGKVLFQSRSSNEVKAVSTSVLLLSYSWMRLAFVLLVIAAAADAISWTWSVEMNAEI